MSTVNLEGVRAAVPEFVTSRLMPSAPGWLKFALGAALPSLPDIAAARLQAAAPALKALGIMTSAGAFDLEALRAALDAGFKSSPSFSFWGFTFTRADGDALLAALEKHSA